METQPAMLAEVVARFLSARRQLGEFSERTHTAYECDLRQLTEFVGCARPLGEVTEDDIQSWVGEMKAAGYAGASVRRKVAVARCFFTYCVRLDLASVSPMKRLRLRFRHGDQLPRTLSSDELRRLLAAVDAAACRRSTSRRQYSLALRNRAIVHLLLATGLRVGELISLELEDIDLAARAVRVRGKGGRERLALLESEECIASLDQHIRSRSRASACGRRVFLNARGTPLSSQGVAYVLRRTAQEAGVERHITPHMFRHTAATLLMSAGVDIRLVQSYLGHRSIVTTQRYTHVSNGLLRRSLAMADPLGQVSRTA